MALLDIRFKSEVLGMGTAFYAIVPDKTPGPHPTLLLLHGLSDDHTVWQRRTSIERYAEPLDLAVIMPTTHRGFYTDMAHGPRYWTFISEEIPAVARRLLPLSKAREDNFVAGLSMGGYGAFKLALTHPDRYAAAASLSGALEIASVGAINTAAVWQAELADIFGDMDTVAGTHNDIFHLAGQAAEAPQRPRLFQCCGTEDFLIEHNRRFRAHAEALGYDLTYEEEPANHNWAYWDQQIQQVLAWLSLAAE